MAKLDTVLVVDDEPPIRRLLRTSLAASGYRIVEAEDAAGAMRALATEKPDLMIIDLGLPDKGGLELISEIRKTSAVPIVVLSARHDERSKVEALDLGADDYVSKPFGMAELLARLRAALRHAFQVQGELPAFVSGDLTVDLVRRHVERGGREVKLSPKEFDLLRHLVMHAGKVLTHRHLLGEVWGPAQADEVQYLRVFIRGLRQKLEPDPTRPTHPVSATACSFRLTSEFDTASKSPSSRKRPIPIQSYWMPPRPGSRQSTSRRRKLAPGPARFSVCAEEPLISSAASGTKAAHQTRRNKRIISGSAPTCRCRSIIVAAIIGEPDADRRSRIS